MKKIGPTRSSQTAEGQISTTSNSRLHLSADELTYVGVDTNDAAWVLSQARNKRMKASVLLIGANCGSTKRLPHHYLPSKLVATPYQTYLDFQ